uniref:Dual specificity protein phosphatase n=1 Tax=Sarcophilus harrisii TaxID=9305 RepID=A0A7N4NZ88_SARHA
MGCPPLFSRMDSLQRQDLRRPKIHGATRVSTQNLVPYQTPTLAYLQRLLWIRRASSMSHINEVWPNLYLGDAYAARDKSKLCQLGITHIVNVAAGRFHVDTGAKFYRGMPVEYYGIEADDNPFFDLSIYFLPAARYIRTALSNQGEPSPPSLLFLLPFLFLFLSSSLLPFLLLPLIPPFFSSSSSSSTSSSSSSFSFSSPLPPLIFPSTSSLYHLFLFFHYRLLFSPLPSCSLSSPLPLLFLLFLLFLIISSLSSTISYFSSSFSFSYSFDSSSPSFPFLLLFSIFFSSSSSLLLSLLPILLSPFLLTNLTHTSSFLSFSSFSSSSSFPLFLSLFYSFFSSPSLPFFFFFFLLR